VQSVQHGKAGLRPLADILVRRHGWNYFDFKIRDNMAARRGATLDWSRGFGQAGFARGYLRSPKRYRRWLGFDRVTYFDELMQPGDPILFENAGFEWIMRRGLFEVCEQCVGVKSIDEHRRSYETEDDALFDCVGIIEKLDGFDFTVGAEGRSWRISYTAMTYTPHVYLKQ